MVERCIDRLRDILESGAPKEEMRAMSEEFSEWAVDLVFNEAPEPLSSLDQIDIIRQIEINAL